MSWKNDALFWLNAAGLQVASMVAGMTGAMVSLVHEKQISRRRMFAILLVGTVAAGYLTPLVSHLTGMPEKMANSLAFLVGLMSMKITDALLKAGIWAGNNIGNILKSYTKNKP